MSVSADNAQPLFEPDADIIRQHLELLFRRARISYPDGLCEIAWSDGTGAVNSANTFPITPEGLDQATALAVTHNRNGRNLYVGINPRKPGTKPYGRAKATDVEVAFFQFAEIDDPEGAALLRGAPLPYTWAVTTGRVPTPRPHPYWELDEPIRNLSAWSAQQKALAAIFRGDEMSNPDRIMRLAGTVNYPSPKKIERGYRVEKVTLRHLYDGEERAPVSNETLFRVYPWATGGEWIDPETGEVRGDGAGTRQRGSEQHGTSGPDFTAGTGSRVDPEALVSAIVAGDHRHDNTLSLVAHLVNTGHRDWIIRALLERILPASEGNTLAQLPEMIHSARVKWHRPDPTAEEEEDFTAPPPEEPKITIKAVPYVLRDPATIPRRDWLYGRHLIRGYVSCTVAPGGYGKSSMITAEALAMATGRCLLDDQPKGKLRVWHINLEDPLQELDRKFHAAATHYEIDEQDINEHLFVGSGRDTNVVIAKEGRDGLVVVEPIIAAIKEEINNHKIDVLQIDPFVASHEVNENDNTKIAIVVRKWAMIAEETNCAIELVHHVRKGLRGQDFTVEDARGASALLAAVRSARVLNGMSSEDAEKAGVENPNVYFQVANGKANLAPRGAKAAWRHIASVSLGNGGSSFDTGDSIGVVELWSWPDPFIGMSTETAREVQRKIASGEWRHDPRSPTWAGIAVAEVLDIGCSSPSEKAQISGLLQGWIASGALVVQIRKDENRKDRKFIEVGQWIT